MSYKKYIVKNGKTYGPYTYYSRMVNGKVISEYKGKGSFNLNLGRYKAFAFVFIYLFIAFFIISPIVKKIFSEPFFFGRF